MPDPVNLRHVRKAKARSEKKREAAQNRVTFGQSKADKALNRAVTSLAGRRLDAVRCDTDSDT
jgi:hypothetical protein